MRKLKCLGFIGVLLGACLVANAQDEQTAVLCDPADAANKCPGDDCVCVPDTLEVTFDGDTQSILEYADFATEIEGQDIDVTLITETKTAQVQGWSYGVAHDMAAVTISEANITGTDAEGLLDFGFDATSAEDIETCGVGDATCDAANRTDGGGFISAVVLSFTKPVELPMGRNSIANAKYQVTVDVGAVGTVLAISNQQAKKNSPPTDINLTISGKSKKWETAVNGWIKQEGPGPCVPTEPDAEVTCDDGLDNDCDELIDMDDPDCDPDPCVPTEPDAEVTCDDGLDNDCDELIDMDDPDCDPDPCVPTEPDAEVTCDDGLDNDCDELIDMDDPDCDPDPCVPTEPDAEVTCDDGLDNDCDELIDMDDPDCDPDPCVPTEPDKEVTCDDGLDNDCDGLIDGDDPDCAVGECTAPDYALYFGADTTAATVDLGDATEYVVTCRNALNALGFQFGVSSTTAADTTTWEFSGALGADADRLIELIITDENGDSPTPETPNKATSSESNTKDIVRGAALEGFTARDFFAFDLAPGVGGPGYTVGYVSDTNPPVGAGNEIPATDSTSPCPTNEILKVTLGPVGDVQFARGDADANGKINVSDAVLIIQIVVGNLQERKDCDKALDADDSGTLTVTDAIPVLNYVFDINGGAALPDPFKVCGEDPTADELTCAETNCQ